ncbi:MAG: TatD family hydrolase [Fusobacteriaceae bacterium]|jgi:TatD DNase family protein|nr:TatD family hydrolase [Fusobacteriaceae bacterium]
MNYLVDSHVHIDSKEFNMDRGKVLERIKEKMDFVVNIGCDIKSSRIGVEYSKKYPFIYATVGIHPENIGNYSYDTEKELERLAKNPKVVAIGEIGLDYHWMIDPKEEQIEVFIEQMKIAERLGKPVVIHTRDAMEDTLDVLSKFPNIKGILHCYPGSVDIALKMQKNYYFGIGGVLTFKTAKKLIEVVKGIDISRLVLETDCPYLTPEPYRGRRNEPIYVEYVAQKIAEIKEMSYEDVIKITNENARKAYNI